MDDRSICRTSPSWPSSGSTPVPRRVQLPEPHTDPLHARFPRRLFHDNLAILATQCTFMTALCFGGFCMLPDKIDRIGAITYQREEILHYLNIAHYVCTTCGTCLNMAAVVIASHGMMFGPSLAIRGPHGSMSRAVQAMLDARRHVLRLFWAGLLFLMLSIIFVGWLKLDWVTATCMTAVACVFLALIVVYIIRKARPQFAFANRMTPSARPLRGEQMIELELAASSASSINA